MILENIKKNWNYIKNFNMNSLFWRTFIVMSLLLIVPFVSLSAVFYTRQFKTMRSEIASENSVLLNSAESIVDDTLNECDMMSSYIATNESAQLFTLTGNISDSFTSLINLANTLPIIYQYIDSIYIYAEDLDCVYVDGVRTAVSLLDDSGWLDGYRSVTGQKGAFVLRDKKNVYPSLISIIKPIYVADEKKGAVIMNINSQTLYYSLLSKRFNNDSQEIFLVDSENRIVLSKDISNFNKDISDIGFTDMDFYSEDPSDTYEMNGENYVVLRSNSRINKYTYISMYSMSPYEENLSHAKTQLILISLSLLLLGFALAYIASANSYTPFREIISFLDDTSVSESNVTPRDQNELKYIIDSIKLHIDDKTRMEETLKERMSQLNKAQYDMLQSQINPHFLYNTLETINWMAYDLAGSENPVSTALVDLAGFFRNTISSSGYLISIKEEIQYTTDYLNILMLRYRDLFDIKWKIDSSILSFRIIKICFQPVIENAVYHGFKPKAEKGMLSISGDLEDDNIVFTISDDGAGMDEDTLAALNSSLCSTVYTGSGSHIGLANVNKRIKIIFGEAYGLSVDSRPNAGTSVRITIPAVN